MKRAVVFEDPLAPYGDKHSFGFEEYLNEKRQLESPTLTVRNQVVCRYFAKGFCVQGTTCPHKHCERKKKKKVFFFFFFL